MALDGGLDGLDFYRKIANESKDFMTDNGKIILEIGFGQRDDVNNLLIETECKHVFHKNCLLKLLQPYCPLCRNDITKNLLDCGLSKKEMKNNDNCENFRIDVESLIDDDILNIDPEELDNLMDESMRIHKIKTINMMFEIIYNYISNTKGVLNDLYTLCHKSKLDGYFIVDCDIKTLLYNIKRNLSLSFLSWIRKKNIANYNLQIQNKYKYLDNLIKKNKIHNNDNNSNNDEKYVGIIININKNGKNYCDSKLLNFNDGNLYLKHSQNNLIKSFIMCDYNPRIIYNYKKLNDKDIMKYSSRYATNPNTKWANRCIGSITNDENEENNISDIKMKSLLNATIYNFDRISKKKYINNQNILPQYDDINEYEYYTSDYNDLNDKQYKFYDSPNHFVNSLTKLVKKKHVVNIIFCVYYDNSSHLNYIIKYEYERVYFVQTYDKENNENNNDNKEKREKLFTPKQVITFLKNNCGDNFNGNITIYLNDRDDCVSYKMKKIE